MDFDSVCDYCRGINLEDLKSDDGYLHQPTFAAIVSSSATCKLCKIMLGLLEESFKRLWMIWGRIDPSKLTDANPVRLVAAGEDIYSRTNGGRKPRPINTQRLHRSVAVILGGMEKKSWFFHGAAVLDMYSAKGSPAYSAGVAAITSIEDRADCELNFSRMKSWLQNCKQKHAMCGLGFLEPLARLSGMSGLPRRLIDVEAGEPAQVKLIETRGRREEYAALSYCWGKQKTYITARDNLAEIFKGVEITRFPQTIQDAIITVRKLGIKYLWVDALCIIQDDEKDWKEEASRMGWIYANAYLTLAATSAKSSTEGFLSGRQTQKVTLGFRVNRNSDIQGEFSFRKPSDFVEDQSEYILNSPLLKRGWVKQERILSRRTVDFSSKQVYFECRTSVASEDRRTESADDRRHASELMNMVWVLSQQGNNEVAEPMFDLFFSIWGNIVEDYSGLNLTRASDKLPALQGLANFTSLARPGRYLCGIWEHNLADGLLWEPKERPTTAVKELVAPSWSWASSKSPVMPGGRMAKESRVDFRGISDDSPFQQKLKLYGKIHRCYVSLQPLPPPPPDRSDRKFRVPPISPTSYALTFDAEGFSGSSKLDDTNMCRFDRDRGDEMDFSFLRLAESENTVHCRGLLLRRTDPRADEGTYERVGMGWCSKQIWTQIEASEICLI